jgi:hypothetical protein
MSDNAMKLIIAIALALSGLVILGGLGYLITGWIGNPSESYQRSLTLDKLYDEAGGNDPLSDAIMTTQIDISTENNSCAFLMTHKGVKGRKIECKSGCTTDPEDEDSNFCKQFIYKDPAYPKGDTDDKTESLSDDILDKTYIRRRNASRTSNDEDDDGQRDSLSD